jgi:hypothetical protein
VTPGAAIAWLGLFIGLLGLLLIGLGIVRYWRRRL